MTPRGFFGILASLLALGWLCYTYDFAEFVSALARAQAVYLIPAFGLLLLSFLVRALRWRAIFSVPARPSLPNAFATMMTGYLFNNLMPARAGELVRVYLLAKVAALSKSMVLGTVVVERVADFMVFGVLLAFAMQAQPVPDWVARAIATLVIMGALALGALALFQGLAGRAWRLFSPALNALPDRFSQSLQRIARSLLAGIQGLAGLGAAARFIGYSVVIWLAELGILGTIAFAFGLPLGFRDVLFVLLVIAAGSIVPASPGYVGTFEFFGLKALALLGHDGPVALGFVVTLHAVSLLGSSALGALGLMAIHRGGSRIPQRAADLLKD